MTILIGRMTMLLKKSLKAIYHCKLERVIGIILLIPPLLGVFLFLLNLFFGNIDDIVTMSNLSQRWSGRMEWAYTGNAGAGAGYTSSTPIYLGLMAIAGAVLLKGSGNKE